MNEELKDVNPSESSTEEDIERTTVPLNEPIAEEGVKEEGPKAIPYQRFKEVNDKYKELKDKLKSLQSEPQQAPAEKRAGESDDEWKQRVNFMLAHKEVSPEEADIIARLKHRDQDFEEALNSKEIKDFLSFRREKAEKEKQILSPSAASTSAKQSKPMSEMSNEEFYTWAAEQEKKVAGRERI